MSSARISVAIIGSGNIGTDLMIKILRSSEHLDVGAMVGIDPDSDGLARASRMGVPTTAQGIDGLLAMPNFSDIRIAFDATSAGAHKVHDAKLRAHGVRVVDLTPAAIGPFVIPVVNFDDHAEAPNVNMVTCGGQATIPVVQAVSSLARVQYAEIVAAISSKSAGSGTRANIDEFTETTSRAIVEVGGADQGKAIIVLNPAEPPLIMRDTVYCFVPPNADTAAIAAAIEKRVAEVARYVPGYRLKQQVQFEHFGDDNPQNIPGVGWCTGIKVAVYLEVEGAGHYLPAYAGNLDIMTSAAMSVGERIAQAQTATEGV
ncbi:acetaldehyde dehydrogenase (acetylating) [Marinobacter adhaerens]|jgi:acetaldehyde dehydrogenase|uniref:acetaldehyde dehydrogenase (acetylating) n=1 Tax=Marinobacter adhaerens TaxID=1033846 RepID=UPI001E5C4E1D|nr:acetaldehyde dehydrogenase (acetylating) [Marinobacter adhaerens]MCD1648634.1 acetaldehyde dehydrogenase (acetylating) [Marinobacter adhaerens]